MCGNREQDQERRWIQSNLQQETWWHDRGVKVLKSKPALKISAADSRLRSFNALAVILGVSRSTLMPDSAVYSKNRLNPTWKCHQHVRVLTGQPLVKTRAERRHGSQPAGP